MKYTEGMTIELRTQMFKGCDGKWYTAYYPHTDADLTQAEGWASQTLTAGEAFCLNEYGRFVCAE